MKKKTADGFKREIRYILWSILIAVMSKLTWSGMNPVRYEQTAEYFSPHSVPEDSGLLTVLLNPWTLFDKYSPGSDLEAVLLLIYLLLYPYLVFLLIRMIVRPFRKFFNKKTELAHSESESERESKTV